MKNSRPLPLLGQALLIFSHLSVNDECRIKVKSSASRCDKARVFVPSVVGYPVGDETYIKTYRYTVYSRR